MRRDEGARGQDEHLQVDLHCVDHNVISLGDRSQ